MISKPVRKPVVAPMNAATGNVQPPSQNVQLPHCPVSNSNYQGLKAYNNQPVSMPPLGSKPK